MLSAVAVLSVSASLAMAQDLSIEPEPLHPDPVPPKFTFSFVCTAEEEMASGSEIQEALVKWFDLEDVSEVEDFDSGEDLFKGKDATETVSFKVNGKLFAAGLVPTKIPKKDLDYACANSFYWPKASEAVKRHENHLIVLSMGEYETALERMFDLSRAVAAFSECHDSVAVYWGSGSIVHEPKQFRKQLKESGTKMTELPVVLWVGFLRTGIVDGKVDFYTDGMDQLGLREFEVVGSEEKPSDILGFLYGMCQYTMIKGNVIKDGDTVGGSEEHRITTGFAESEIGREGSVILVDF